MVSTPVLPSDRPPVHPDQRGARGGVIVAHTGVDSSTRELLVALHERGLLDRFVTTVGFSESGLIGRGAAALGDRARDLLGFRLLPLPPSRIAYRPPIEIARLVAKRVGPNPADWLWERGDWWFSRRVAAEIHEDTGGVLAFEHLALEAFQRARSLGVPTVHRTVALPPDAARRIYDRQKDLFPDLFRGQMAVQTAPHTVRRDRRKDEELRLADSVICNTSYIRRTLVAKGIPEETIHIVPYGFPDPNRVERRPSGGKVIFLHAGSLSIIKGTPYVYEAWRRLAPPSHRAELWLAGTDYLDVDLETLPGTVRNFGRVSRARLFKLYAEASVLVFPSLGEGFGLVLSEAMGTGLPAITTDRTAACDFVRHGDNGWIVEAEDADAIAEAMEERLFRPEETAAAGAAAIETARSWTWADHRRLMAETIARLTVDQHA